MRASISHRSNSLWQRFCRSWFVVLAIGPIFIVQLPADADWSHRGFVSWQGYVFLDGQYLEPPYRVERVGMRVEVNGELLQNVKREVAESDELGFDVASLMVSRPRMGRFRRRFEPRGEPPFGELASLAIGDIVILTSGKPVVLLDGAREGQDLLYTLALDRARRDVNSVLADSKLSSDQRQIVAQLVADFEPTESFLTRSVPQVERQVSTQKRNDSAMLANVWIGRLNYPLTLFAMFVVVISFGHLLNNRPYIDIALEESTRQQLAHQTVVRSLLIVGCLSVVDLAWTILAAQTGMMREINPLGNGLIHDPLLLVLFKVAMVSLATGLIYRLYRQPLAQAASWWSCLVLTLVTARWLTFSSMFL